MKIALLLCAAFLSAAAVKKCNSYKKGEQGSPLRGKLEIKAICMNYTIRLLEGDIDSSLVSASWTDESTGKTYRNVFALGSRCSFPAEINEGDEFYFIPVPDDSSECIVCLAYYPTPPRKLSIKVVGK